MTDKNPTDVTSSAHSDGQPSSVSAVEVAEAIETEPDEWIRENDQVIGTNPVGDATAKEIRQAFENKRFPDGTPLSNATGMVSNEIVRDTFSDYLANPDDWQVRDRQNIDPWATIYAAYNDPDRTTRIARQRAVEQLKDEPHIEPLEDTDELVWYNHKRGIYEDDGERIVKERLESKLREYNTPSEAKHILHKLKSQPSLNESAFTSEGKVCVMNGVLDVSEPSDPTLESHSPDLRFRERLAVKYDPNADCPRFREFVNNRVAEGHKDKLQEFVGYTAFHPWEMPYHKALMIVGPTATGKSTFLNVLTALLGEENVSHLSIQQLANDEYALAQADGTFANISNDLDASIVKNLGQFKHIAAGEPVEANQKYKPYRTVRMTQKQIYAANRVPEVKDEDDAFYRRWLHVQFPETIPREERKERFEDELKGELPGILNWALEGYARLMENGGFTNELSLEEKRNLWKAYGNSIDRFVGEQTERVSGADIPKDELYAAYERFCEEQGLPTKPKQTFTKHLKRDYGVDTSRPNLNGEQVRCYRGLHLPDTDESEEPESDSRDWCDELATSE
jgi:putative DNA primase/helicase